MTSTEFETLVSMYNKLESRVARLEASTQQHEIPASEPEVDSTPQEETPDAEALEMRIGEDWFAKLGIVILAIGIGFLLSLPYASFPAILPPLVGYIIAGGLIQFARRGRESFQHISGYLLGGGIALLFFSTLRLHFFSPQPVLGNTFILHLLLSASVVGGIWFGHKRQSVYITALALTLGYAVILIADSVLALIAGITLLSIVAVVLSHHHTWKALLAHTAGLNIFTHFLWSLNSPVLGRPVEWITAPEISILFMLVNIAIIAYGTLTHREGATESGITILIAAVNGLCAYALFLLLTSVQFRDQMVVLHCTAAILLLGIAVAFWVRERSKYSTFVYVMLGYLALSVAIIAQFESPDFFIWLSWQSLIVISTAVWFRSRFIVVANFFIFLTLLGSYVVLAGTIGLISLGFGVVALLSARVLNSQKHRLELKTELMRNAYLATAFVVFPYALYNTVPREMLSISWLGVALFYYIMSRAVNSTKYRWMSLLTLLLTVVNVLAVDITNLTPTYRILSFIILGVVLLVISILYSRRRLRKKASETDTTHETSPYMENESLTDEKELTQ